MADLQISDRGEMARRPAHVVSGLLALAGWAVARALLAGRVCWLRCGQALAAGRAWYRDLVAGGLDVFGRPRPRRRVRRCAERPAPHGPGCTAGRNRPGHLGPALSTVERDRTPRRSGPGSTRPPRTSARWTGRAAGPASARPVLSRHALLRPALSRADISRPRRRTATTGPGRPGGRR
ncbi:hypothetical protein [Goodfellowiella coeruleoviolacea]|uniref:hypothetical protein n=1 Tax=Goodfellowiella coeruleoviolacea TaxID=334858 RepID=UPI0020A4A2F4|nr:hypothetical protein [Goodfellowiella coeruleoviolacea]